MENENKELVPAPIDNKNVLEDFADAFCDICEQSWTADMHTFWRDGCLYVVEYKFGESKGLIKCVYGTPKDGSADEILAKIDSEFNTEDNNIHVGLKVVGNDVKFRFVFKLDSSENAKNEAFFHDIFCKTVMKVDYSQNSNYNDDFDNKKSLTYNKKAVF